MTEQLNKLQIKAEILIAITNLMRTNMSESVADNVLKTLSEQEDKASIYSILLKELTRADEQKVIIICFMLLKLFEHKEVEDGLWELLKNNSVNDVTKSVILNVLKDMGNKIEYETIEQCFENPEEVIDADTKRLLQNAVFNPEAQIDFMDFLCSLPDEDKILLVQSLGDDYSSDDLANILSPVVLYNPQSRISMTAIDILGETKSQIAFYTLQQLLNYELDDVTLALAKKNISKLKLSGIREENVEEFYRSFLNSMPYDCFSSYPDGHGNQAVIFSREREDEHIQMLAVVLNDTYGIIDCFGFNEITKYEFERIVDKFYGYDTRIFIDAHVAKKILDDAELLTRKLSNIIPYEYLCWKSILFDSSVETVPIKMKLDAIFNFKKLEKNELDKILMLDLVQKWFFDTEVNDKFSKLTGMLNEKLKNEDYSFDLEELVVSNCENIFDEEKISLFDKRILMASYLDLLSGKNNEAKLLYSLFKDEEAKQELYKNILRKSFYEYYVSLKFKIKEESKTTNIFAMRNRKKTVDMSASQIDKMVSIIEDLWVNA